MYQLCLGCWRSRLEAKFDQHKSGNRRSLCYDCRNARRAEPKTLYYREQKSKPVDLRMKICTMCFEEKFEAEFHKKGDGRVSSRCIPCRRGTFRTEEYREYANNYMREKRRKNPEVVLRISEYNRNYRKTDAGRQKHRESHLMRKSKIKSQEYSLSPDFFELMLETYGQRCMQCGESQDLQYDHIVPVSWGRVCDWSILNAQILCSSCNIAKSDRISIDFRPMSVPIPGEEDCIDIDLIAML